MVEQCLNAATHLVTVFRKVYPHRCNDVMLNLLVTHIAKVGMVSGESDLVLCVLAHAHLSASIERTE